MTIASEITRLQNDKAAICTAIENKGVTVGNVTLDDYASCIDAIQTGTPTYCIDLLVVGGGGGGGAAGSSCYTGNTGGGGGGGAVMYVQGQVLTTKSHAVYVGCAGAGGTSGSGSNGGYSKFGELPAMYGGGGGGGSFTNGCAGGSGGGGGGGSASCTKGTGGAGCDFYGTDGATAANGIAGGGGGAGGGGTYLFCSGLVCGCCIVSSGGKGIISNITGSNVCYAGGGGGGTISSAGGSKGCYGGGKGTCVNGSSSSSATAATTCGSGGGGGACSKSYYRGCNGACGIVIVRYPTSGTYGFTCATGGTVTTSGSYKIHTFTSNGTFTIVS